MNKSVEQALTSLIPRHNGTLPEELTELASSLLAQSKAKASTLKAEEEIGRIYACANIACERLKQSLDLPKIEPRPPCPPRVYAKLYTYLDSALPSRKRGRSKNTPSANSTPSKPLPSRPTPTKAASLLQFQSSPAKSIRESLRHNLQHGSSREIASWIQPTIRQLCKVMQTPAAMPHVLAGVTTILTQAGPLTSSKETIEQTRGVKVPSLIAAVFLFVRTRLSGIETSPKEYQSSRKRIIDTLQAVRRDDVVTKALQQSVQSGLGWQTWEDPEAKDVDNCLLDIPRLGYETMDWFQNIVEGSGLMLPDDIAMAELETLETDGPAVSKSSSQAGLGTMMQEKTDYLSEARRAEFRTWKRKIMERIQLMEAAG